MKIAVFAYSRQGCETAKRVRAHFSEEECTLYTMERFEMPDFLPICRPATPFYGKIFNSVDAMVFVGSCGIAVREIAAFVRDKRTDPAVLSLDERATFVIPLLSGHIGGANEMALSLASFLGATAVVTTATDVNGKFSVDAWAARQGYAIGNMATAKAVSAAILERDVPICTPLPVTTAYPAGTVAGDSGDIGIYVGWEKKKPFEKTLHIIPKVLHLGIGCRKGTEKETIDGAVSSVFRENGLDLRAVKCVASIDLKAKEAGILEFCEEEKLPVSFYTAQELLAVEGEFTPSEFVKSITGVDNVCERSALLGADQLIVRKTAINGVTVAVAAENVEVRFE